MFHSWNQHQYQHIFGHKIGWHSLMKTLRTYTDRLFLLKCKYMLLYINNWSCSVINSIHISKYSVSLHLFTLHDNRVGKPFQQSPALLLHDAPVSCAMRSADRWHSWEWLPYERPACMPSGLCSRRAPAAASWSWLRVNRGVCYHVRNRLSCCRCSVCCCG